MTNLTHPLSASTFSLRLPAVPVVLRRVLPDVLSFLCLAYFAMLAYVHLSDVSGAMDIGVYSDIANRANDVLLGTRAHVESEYPPLATALFWIVRSISTGRDFAPAWLVTIVVSSLFVWAYLRCTSARDALIFAIVLPVTVLLLGYEMVLSRYDIFVCLSLILSAKSHAHRSYAESAGWLSVAIALKVVPVLALPLLIVATPYRHWKSLLIGAVFAAVIGSTLSMSILGTAGIIDNISYVIRYHAGRPVQLESLWSGLTMLQALAAGKVSSTAFDHMSLVNMDTSMHVIPLAKVLVIAGLSYLLVRLWKRKDCRNFGMLLAGILLWSLTVSPVLSPQYFTWVVPLILVVMSDSFFERGITRSGIAVTVLTVLVALFTQWIFPYHYDALIAGDTLPVLILNLRNLILVLLTFLIVADIGMLPHLHRFALRTFSRSGARALVTDAVFAGVVFLGTFVLLVTQPSARTLKMLYTRATSWSRSPTHAPIFWNTSQDGRVTVST